MLYDKGEPPEPSAKVVAYERYRDAYLAAAIEYNNRRGEASMASSDLAVKAAWEAEEPTLRTEVQDASAAWSGPGNRAEVEDARRVVRDLGSESAQVARAGYRKLFDPDLPEIFFRTSADGLSYLPTGYMPTDVADVAWPRITVSADELAVLADSAPEELRSRLGSSGDAGISMVSFEYSYVTVARPWFTPQAFASTGWRFREPERFLSDGGSPPKGECTAYVTGLVFARNITVRHRTKAGGAPPTVDLGFLPNLAVMKSMEFRPLPTAEVADLPAERLRMVVLDDPAVWAAARARGDEPGAVGQPAAVATPVTAPSSPALSGKRLRVAAIFKSLRKPDLQVRALEPTPESTSLTETTTASDEVYVLALQCRLLPKSPAATRPGRGSEQAKIYVVVAGDTLGKIAAKFYGKAAHWRKIYDANRSVIGHDPDVIRVGQELTIP